MELEFKLATKHGYPQARCVYAPNAYERGGLNAIYGWDGPLPTLRVRVFFFFFNRGSCCLRETNSDPVSTISSGSKNRHLGKWKHGPPAQTQLRLEPQIHPASAPMGDRRSPDVPGAHTEGARRHSLGACTSSGSAPWRAIRPKKVRRCFFLAALQIGGDPCRFP